MEGQTISTTQKKKTSKKYERFGEIIRHFTLDETQQLFDSIDNYKHKLMFEIIYELGCRVGEFVRIQVKHLNFNRSTVFFPAENTKTKHARISYLPKGLTNEIKSMLKQKGIINKRDDKIKNSEVQLVINTPAGKLSKYDDSYIRKTAIKYHVPYITTSAAAAAAVKGIAARQKDTAPLRSLQSYHAGIK